MWFFLLMVAALIAAGIVNHHFRVFPIRLCTLNGKSSFSVLCYNVHSLEPKFESHACSVANMLEFENPTFVFLAEYYGTVTDILHHRMIDIYSYVDSTYRWVNNGGEVFYSKWPIDSITKYRLQGHYHSGYRVQVHCGADTVVVYCCHLSSNNLKLAEGRWASLEEGRRLRRMEVDTLYNAIRNENHPTIVMGDMNDVSGTYSLRKIESAGLTDAWWKGGCGYGSTYHGGWLRLRLDHILYEDKRLKLKEIKIIGNDAWSDHNTLVAGFDYVKK